MQMDRRTDGADQRRKQRLLRRTTAKLIAGRTKCDSAAQVPALSRSAALEALDEVGSTERVELVIMDEEALELLIEVVVAEEDELVETELDDEPEVVEEEEEEEEDVSVLMELMENVMRLPKVAAASVDLDEDEGDAELEERADVGEAVPLPLLLLLDWARTWVNKAARHRSRVGDEEMNRTILCASTRYRLLNAKVGDGGSRLGLPFW